jgi:hypothetical protein
LYDRFMVRRLGFMAWLPLVAACTLLAPTDEELQGDLADASVDHAANPSGSDGATADGGGGPDGSSPGPDGSPADAGVPDSPACSACRSIGTACLANASCSCLQADLCDGGVSCTEVNGQVTVSCGATSCTSSTSHVVGCLIDGDYCRCN